jgi:hypothetical protein
MFLSEPGSGAEAAFQRADWAWERILRAEPPHTRARVLQLILNLYDGIATSASVVALHAAEQSGLDPAPFLGTHPGENLDRLADLELQRAGESIERARQDLLGLLGVGKAPSQPDAPANPEAPGDISSRPPGSQPPDVSASAPAGDRALGQAPDATASEEQDTTVAGGGGAATPGQLDLQAPIAAAFVAMAEEAFASGDLARVQRLVASVPHGPTAKVTLLTAQAARFSARLAALHGDPDAAWHAFETAIGLFDRLGARDWLAVTRLEYAQLLIA